MENLSRQIGKLSVNSIRSTIVCKICVENHTMAKCHQGNSFGHSSVEHAAYVDNPNRQNNLYSNTYNSSWSNLPNFSWSNNQGVAPRSPSYASPEKKFSMEEMFKTIIQKRDHNMQKTNQNIEKTKKATHAEDWAIHAEGRFDTLKSWGIHWKPRNLNRTSC